MGLGFFDWMDLNGDGEVSMAEEALMGAIVCGVFDEDEEDEDEEDED